MKKVLIVTALAGFIRSFLANDIKILQEMGYEVYCAANKFHPGAEEIEKYFNENNVKFLQIDFSSNKPLSIDTFNSYRQFKNIIKKFNFDVIHCHTPIAGAIVRWGCRKGNMKVIYTTHGFYFHKGSSKKSWLLFRNIENFMSKYSDAIITINNEDYNNAKKMHCKNVYIINGVGVDTNKFKTINIDKNEYRKKIGINDDEIMILSIGELSKRKNHKVVLQAISLLNNPKIVFVHCGNSMNNESTFRELELIAKEKNIKAVFLGLRRDIPEICACADVGTLSSTREGLGLAGIEMIASGLPIVASNVHGIVDYVQDGLNGYLVDPNSPEEFAKKINEIINSKKWNKEKIMNSVEKFDVKNSYNQLKNIYEEIL